MNHERALQDVILTPYLSRNTWKQNHEIGTYGEFPSFPSAVRVAKVFHRLPGNVTIPDYYWAELIHAQIQKPGLECTGSQARHSRWPVFLLFLPTFWYHVDILSTILAGT